MAILRGFLVFIRLGASCFPKRPINAQSNDVAGAHVSTRQLHGPSASGFIGHVKGGLELGYAISLVVPGRRPRGQMV